MSDLKHRRICRLESNFRFNKASTLCVAGFEHSARQWEKKRLPELHGQRGAGEGSHGPCLHGFEPRPTATHRRTLHLVLSASLRLSFLVCEVGVLWNMPSRFGQMFQRDLQEKP